MAVDTDREQSATPHASLTYLQLAVALLTGLLALSLLVVGTVAVIAEIKGTWHWSIHLESTISYIGMFVSGLVVVLVPLFLALVVGRWVVDDG